MRTLTQAFRQANGDFSSEPRVAVKIENQAGNLWLLSHADIDPQDVGADLFPGVIVNATGGGERLTPERGFSELGGYAVTLQDVGFTEYLRILEAANNSLYNNKLTVYFGYEGLGISDYLAMPPGYISQINNGLLEYTLITEDVQAFQRVEIFTGLVEVRGVNALGTGTGALTVGTTDGLERVQHTSEWADAPGETVGYLALPGVTEDGEDVVEYLRWSSKTATTLEITGRGLFGSGVLDLKENALLTEVVYLDLPHPRMVVALLTGDLVGQPGQVIPAHWHAGLTAAEVDVASITGIGNGLDAVQLQLVTQDSVNAKDFIAQQALAPFNVAFKISAAGELQMRTYSVRPQFAPGGVTLSNFEILDTTRLERDATQVRNQFKVLWNWSPAKQGYTRRATYVDADSAAYIDRVTDALEIDLRMVTNTATDNKAALDKMAEGIRARFSRPRVTPSVTAALRDAIQIEALDTVTLDLEGLPDFASDDSLLASYEVQAVRWDFLGGSVSLELFGSDGLPTPIDLAGGQNVPTIDTTGRTLLSAAIAGTDAGGVFTIAAGQSIPSGDYYYPGTVRTPSGVTVAFNGTVSLVTQVFDLVGSAKWDGRGRGNTAGVQGYYGGADAAAVVDLETKSGLLGRWYQGKAGTLTGVPASATAVGAIPARVGLDGTLTGIPATLTGNGGQGGGSASANVGGTPYNAAGGAPVSGGAGLCVIAEAFTYDAGSVIDTSGADGTVGAFFTIAGEDDRFYGGSSGFGWPGAFICLLTDRTAALPAAEDFLVQETGDFTPPPNSIDGFSPSLTSANLGAKNYLPVGAAVNVTPRWDTVAIRQQTKDFSTSASFIGFIGQDAPATLEPGVDTIPEAQAPGLSLAQAVNEPLTPLGNLVTVTMTATPQGGDTQYLHSEFSYRLQGESQWVPIDYSVRNEATFTVTGDGSTYEVRAIPVNTAGVRAINGTVEQITVASVALQTDEGDTAPDVPPVRRLELVNRLDDADGWNQWKGNAAQFKWAKLSRTLGGSIVAIEGRLDLHFANYAVKVFDTVTGELLHETTTTDSFYTYTFEQNNRDTGGAPVRQITISVQATTDSGYSSEPALLSVVNPAPSAPTGLSTTAGLNSIEVQYATPNDFDYRGCNVRVRTTGGTYGPKALATASPVVVGGLLQGTEYEVELTSVDAIGEGSSTSVVATTRDLNAADVGDLSAWATELDPVDLAFIQANMADDAVPSDKVANLTAAKLTAGEVTVAVDLGAGVRLDGATGTIESLNSGYSTVLGPVARPSVSTTDLILHAWDGVAAPFWVNAAGEFSFGSSGNRIQFIGGNLLIDTANLQLNAAGDLTASGEVNATSGTIGGWTCSADTLSAGGITLDGGAGSIATPSVNLDGGGDFSLGNGAVVYDDATDTLVVSRDTALVGQAAWNTTGVRVYKDWSVADYNSTGGLAVASSTQYPLRAVSAPNVANSFDARFIAQALYHNGTKTPAFDSTFWRGRVSFSVASSVFGNATDYMYAAFGRAGAAHTGTGGSDHAVGIQFYTPTGDTTLYARAFTQDGSTATFGSATALPSGTQNYILEGAHDAVNSYTVTLYSINTATGVKTQVLTATFSLALGTTNYLASTRLDMNSTNAGAAAMVLTLYDLYYEQL